MISQSCAKCDYHTPFRPTIRQVLGVMKIHDDTVHQ